MDNNENVPFVCLFFFLSWKVTFRIIFNHLPQISRALALCCSFSGNCELFPRPHRNAEPQSGVDQVTAEQSFFLNASIYPWGLPPTIS